MTKRKLNKVMNKYGLVFKEPTGYKHYSKKPIEYHFKKTALEIMGLLYLIKLIIKNKYVRKHFKKASNDYFKKFKDKINNIQKKNYDFLDKIDKKLEKES